MLERRYLTSRQRRDLLAVCREAGPAVAVGTREEVASLCLEVEELRNRLRWTHNMVSAQMEADRRLGEGIRRALYHRMGTRTPGKAVELTIRWWLAPKGTLGGRPVPRPPLYTIFCGAARWTGSTLRDAASDLWASLTANDPVEDA